MEAGPSKKKKTMTNEMVESKARPNKRMKTMIKETTLVLAELQALPFEVLVKIFNFLPNHDIRCGVSLVCKKFLEICQDESLIPVKDICLYGQPTDYDAQDPADPRWYPATDWDYMKKRQVAAIIRNSQKLTSLKIKTLIADQAVNDLVRIAFQACPQLTHLEIEIGETDLKDLEYNDLLEIIKEHGKDICRINLLIGNQVPWWCWGRVTTMRHALECISAGCPKLKSLTLDYNMWDLEINSLEELRKGCKELKDLKLFLWKSNNAKDDIKNNNAEDDIKKIFPDCNVEIKECDWKLWMKMRMNRSQKRGPKKD